MAKRELIFKEDGQGMSHPTRTTRAEGEGAVPSLRAAPL